MDVNEWVDEASTLGPDETRQALELLRAQMRGLLDFNDGLIENMQRAGRLDARHYPIMKRWAKNQERRRKVIVGG